MNSWDSFIYKSIQKLKSKTSLKILNTLTNNDDLIQICDHIYLGNVNYNVLCLKKMSQCCFIVDNLILFKKKNRINKNSGLSLLC